MPGRLVKKVENLPQGIFILFTKGVQRFNQWRIFDKLYQFLSDHLRRKNYVGRHASTALFGMPSKVAVNGS